MTLRLGQKITVYQHCGRQYHGEVLSMPYFNNTLRGRQEFVDVKTAFKSAPIRRVLTSLIQIEQE